MNATATASQIYNAYAHVYDRTGQIRFSALMYAYLQDIVRMFPLPGRRILDLACGTGTLALMLAEDGWDVSGLDLSPAMLAQARGKQQLSGSDVTFLNGDMRAFSFEPPAHLITCCYDSLNYLLDEDELQACFKSVYAALAPGGRWCFDLATEYFLRIYWQGTEHYQDETYAQVMECWYDETTGRSSLLLTGSTLNGSAIPERFQETHIERSFAPADVAQWLQDAGFTVNAVYDCFTFQTPTDRSLRHFWVATKEQETATTETRKHGDE